MGNVVPIASSHPLIGTWVSDEGDSSVSITICGCTNGFGVTALDRADGEELTVTEVTWNGKTLSFRTHVPSTGYVAMHGLTLENDGSVLHELILYERWIRLP